MLQYTVPATVPGPGGRIWTTRPKPSAAGLVAVLQAPSSKLSDAVRVPDFSVVALDSHAQQLVTVDTRGTVVHYQLRQNRYACLDKTGYPGTAVLLHSARQIFVAFADSTIRCYDASKGIVTGVLKEHRSPVRHLEVNQELGELLSTSADGVLVWDMKKLRRKRALGSGPYGALKACYSSDGQAVVTAFQDGSFYVWSAGSFVLLRSFTLPVAPTLRPAQTTYTLSPNGQLLVSAGPTLPVLLVYNIIAGQLLYGVGLPARPTGTDMLAGVAVVDDEAPGEAAAAAALGVSGSAGLAAFMPMSVGVVQVQFLPDSSTVAALLTDGSMQFVDVVDGSHVGAVPYQFPNRRDCRFSMDPRAQHMALLSNGKALLYDLSATRTSVNPPASLPRVLVEQMDELASAAALAHLRREEEERRADEEQARGAYLADAEERAAAAAAAAASGAAAGLGSGQDTQPQADGRARPGRRGEGGAARQETSTMADVGQKMPGSKQGAPLRKHDRQAQGPGRRTSPATNAGGKGQLAAAMALARAQADPAGVTLHRSRLTALLEAFGEYPAKYRLIIWDFLLQLPHNTAAFSTLAGMGLHPAFKELEAKLPLANRALAQRLAATLSQLAHWCPVFAESSFLPDLAFPFVKLFASASLGTSGTSSAAALDERCFETLATLLGCGWMRGWFERFPHPPLGLLTRLQDLIALHDAPLAGHFATFRGGMAGAVWPHLASLWTGLLPRGDWLKLWDHCITAGPDLLYHFIAAYFISLRSQLLALDTDHKLATWLAGPPDIDMDQVLRTAYLLRQRTPAELVPVPAEWQPLPQGPTYTDFKDFPQSAVELFTADRTRIRDAEEAIMRRRAVVSELELRTRAVTLQAASLSTERQQLAALEEERRAMLRQLETQTAAELARLDDKAKEEKLKQIAAVEKAYQENLLEVRATWHRELEAVRAEVAHKRALAAQQVHSREEDEQIRALEFRAQQRMWALEEDVRKAALASAVRDELAAAQLELQGKQRTKAREWEADEEARRIRLQAETARRTQLAMAAEEGAARHTVAREVLGLALQVEDEMAKVESERRLRRLAEDQALLTAEARATEEARAAARAAAEQEALRMKAKADLAWYEAEQMRREQLLEQERLALEAAAGAARRKLADTEAATRTMAAQAELIDKRRYLERANAVEEAEVRRLVEAMAAERSRDVQLVAQLAAKEEEIKSRLDYAAHVGGLQRAEEAREEAAVAAVRAAMEDVQRREVAEVRRRHEEALAELARKRDGQVPGHVDPLLEEVRGRQLEALRAQHEQLARELGAAQDAVRRAATETGHASGHAAGEISSSSSGAQAGASAIGQAEVSFTSASAGYGTAARQDVQARQEQQKPQQQAQQRPVHSGPVLSRLLSEYTPTRSSTITNSDATPASTTFSSEGLTPLLARHVALRAEQQRQPPAAHRVPPAGQAAAAPSRLDVAAPLPQQQSAIHPAWSQPQTAAGLSTQVVPARTGAATTAASVSHISQPLSRGGEGAGMAAHHNEDRRRSLFPPSPEGSTSTDTDRDGLSQLLQAYRSPLVAQSPPNPSPGGAPPSTSSSALTETTSTTNASRGSTVMPRGPLDRPSGAATAAASAVGPAPWAAAAASFLAFAASDGSNSEHWTRSRVVPSAATEYLTHTVSATATPATAARDPHEDASPAPSFGSPGAAWGTSTGPGSLGPDDPAWALRSAHESQGRGDGSSVVGSSVDLGSSTVLSIGGLTSLDPSPAREAMGRINAQPREGGATGRVSQPQEAGAARLLPPDYDSSPHVSSQATGSSSQSYSRSALQESGLLGLSDRATTARRPVGAPPPPPATPSTGMTSLTPGLTSLADTPASTITTMVTTPADTPNPSAANQPILLATAPQSANANTRGQHQQQHPTHAQAEAASLSPTASALSSNVPQRGSIPDPHLQADQEHHGQQDRPYQRSRSSSGGPEISLGLQSTAPSSMGSSRSHSHRGVPNRGTSGAAPSGSQGSSSYYSGGSAPGGLSNDSAQLQSSTGGSSRLSASSGQAPDPYAGAQPRALHLPGGELGAGLAEEEDVQAGAERSSRWRAAGGRDAGGAPALAGAIQLGGPAAGSPSPDVADLLRRLQLVIREAAEVPAPSARAGDREPLANTPMGTKAAGGERGAGAAAADLSPLSTAFDSLGGTPERDGGSVLTDVSALMRRLGLDSEAAVGASVGTDGTEDPISYGEAHDTMRSGPTEFLEYSEGGSQLTASFASTQATESPRGTA